MCEDAKSITLPFKVQKEVASPIQPKQASELFAVFYLSIIMLEMLIFRSLRCQESKGTWDNDNVPWCVKYRSQATQTSRHVLRELGGHSLYKLR